MLTVYLAAVAVGVGAVAMTLSGWVAATAAGLVFLVAATVSVGAVLRHIRRLHSEQERHRRVLLQTELNTLIRLREASQVREDLIAAVSHEFRTPLTAIRGNAATLVHRYDQLDRDAQEELLVGILEYSDRLSRLLEDILVAASASVRDAGAVSDVSVAVCRFTLNQPRPPLQLDVDAHLGAFIDGESLARVVGALADHVRDAARRDRSVHVQATRRDDRVVVCACYAALRPEDDLTALLDPFGPTGGIIARYRPLSLALYVVRRLVEAHGGTVSTRLRGGEVAIELTFRALGHRVGAATPLPTTVAAAPKMTTGTAATTGPAAAPDRTGAPARTGTAGRIEVADQTPVPRPEPPEPVPRPKPPEPVVIAEPVAMADSARADPVADPAGAE